MAGAEMAGGEFFGQAHRFVGGRLSKTGVCFTWDSCKCVENHGKAQYKATTMQDSGPQKP